MYSAILDCFSCDNFVMDAYCKHHEVIVPVLSSQEDGNGNYIVLVPEHFPCRHWQYPLDIEIRQEYERNVVSSKQHDLLTKQWEEEGMGQVRPDPEDDTSFIEDIKSLYLFWFQCNDGMFGVDAEYSKRAMIAYTEIHQGDYSTTNMHDIYIGGVPIDKMIEWAKRNEIDYLAVRGSAEADELLKNLIENGRIK